MGIRQRSSFVFWSWPSKESASTSKCWVGRMMEKEPWEALVSYHKRKLSERMLTINFLLWWVRNLCSALHKVGLTYNSIWFPFPWTVLSQISHTSKVKTKSFFLSILTILWTWFKKRKVNNHTIMCISHGHQMSPYKMKSCCYKEEEEQQVKESSSSILNYNWRMLSSEFWPVHSVQLSSLRLPNHLHFINYQFISWKPKCSLYTSCAGEY